MQVRGLLMGALLLVLLGGGVWWSQRAEKEKEGKPTADAPPKLVNIKDEDVQRVEVQHKDGPTIILAREKSGWQIIQPQPLRADQEAASGVVSSFTGLSWDRLVEDKPADLSAYGLQTPATVVSLTAKDNKAHRLLIGDETPTGGNFYAKLDGDPRVFAIFSYTKTGLDKSAQDLRDKRLLTFDSEKLSRVELLTKGQAVEFGKNNNNEWQIVKPRPLRADGGQVEELVRKLKDARMDAAVTDESAKQAATAFASGAKIATVNVTDNSGTQTLEARKSGSDYYAKSSAVEGVYKIGNDLGDGLNKTVDDFRSKKLFDFGFTEPNKVEIRGGGKSYSFTKSGDKWWSNGKAVDAVSVQNLIDKLRDLSSIKFVDSGFTSSILDIAVTSNDGKRVENVAVSKSANQYFARRGTEPAIYELDSKAVEEIQRAAADVKEPPPAAKK